MGDGDSPAAPMLLLALNSSEDASKTDSPQLRLLFIFFSPPSRSSGSSPSPASNRFLILPPDPLIRSCSELRLRRRLRRRGKRSANPNFFVLRLVLDLRFVLLVPES